MKNKGSLCTSGIIRVKDLFSSEEMFVSKPCITRLCYDDKSNFKGTVAPVWFSLKVIWLGRQYVREEHFMSFRILLCPKFLLKFNKTAIFQGNGQKRLICICGNMVLLGRGVSCFPLPLVAFFPGFLIPEQPMKTSGETVENVLCSEPMPVFGHFTNYSHNSKKKGQSWDKKKIFLYV